MTFIMRAWWGAALAAMTMMAAACSGPGHDGASAAMDGAEAALARGDLAAAVATADSLQRTTGRQGLGAANTCRLAVLYARIADQAPDQDWAAYISTALGLYSAVASQSPDSLEAFRRTARTVDMGPLTALDNLYQDLHQTGSRELPVEEEDYQETPIDIADHAQDHP